MKTRFLLAVCMMLYGGIAMCNTACPTPSLTATVSDTLICSGTPDTFVALPVNAFAMTYQWYKNGNAVGTDSIYIDATLNDQDSVWVVVTSTCAGTFIDTSQHITISVNPTPSAPMLSLAGGACLGSDSIGAVVGAYATQVTWYNSGSQVGTASLSADTPVTALACCTYSEGLYARGNYLYAASTSADAVYQYPTSIVNGGVGHVVAGDNGGGAGANQLENPRGLFMDRAGNLYVCDLNNDRIQMFPAGSDSLTNGITVAGGNGLGSAANQLSSPIDVYVDSAGYIYVADNYNYRIQKFPPGSTSATDGVTVAGGNGFGTALNQLEYAEGVFLDQAGNVYVADGGNNRILMFPPGSTSATMGTVVAGGNGLGLALNQLYFPRGVALDATGNIYVTDGDRLIMFPAGSTSATNGTVLGGMYTRGANDELSTPIGKVVFDSTGTYMFVDDLLNYRTRRYGMRTYYTPPTAGSYTATYTSALGCVSGVSNAVVVNPSPLVTFGAPECCLVATQQGLTWCVDWNQTIPLGGGTPSGGMYSGNFVTNDSLYYNYANPPQYEDTIFYTYTNNYGCSATAFDTIYMTICSGIQTIPIEASISLYPNPNNATFMLESGDAVGREYIITDMIGRVMAQGIIRSDQQSISLGNISAGSYILQVPGSVGSAVRFVVE